MALAGRLFLATMFLSSAFGKITNFEGTVTFMEANGVAMAPLLCAGAVLLEAFGGIALILGYHVRWGAGALAAFVVSATILFHLGVGERVHLLKNIAIVGGLLQVMAFGPGSISLEGRGRS